jgi:hypothetical protein
MLFVVWRDFNAHVHKYCVYVVHLWAKKCTLFLNLMSIVKLFAQH